MTYHPDITSESPENEIRKGLIFLVVKMEKGPTVAVEVVKGHTEAVKMEKVSSKEVELEKGRTEAVELFSFSQGGEELENKVTSSKVISESKARPNKIISRVSKFLFKRNADSSGENEMKKEINVFTGVAYVAGSIIGSGIFITPRSILVLTRSFGLSMVVWVLGGIMAILGGLCYIELGLLVKKCGAEYSYIKEAYSFKKKHWIFEVLGSLLSFAFLWSSILVIRAAGIGIICLTSARYLISPFYINCDELPENSVVLLALAILVIIGLVNCYGLKLAARMMSIFTISKIFTIIFIVIVGISFIIRRGGFPETFQHPFENLGGEPPTVSSVALSFYSVLFAYEGWNSMNYAVEETKNVKRTMPLAVYIGVSIVIVSYLLVNISFFSVLTYEQIESAVTVALSFGNEAIGTAGLVILPLLVSASAFGAANGGVYSASIIIFEAARDGHAPRFLSGLHVTVKTPVPAIILQVLVSMVLMVAGTIEQLIQAVGFVIYIFVFLSIVAVFIFRVTHAKEPRIFPAWFILPVASIMVCICLFLLIIPVIEAPTYPLIGLGITLASVPVFIILVMEEPCKIRPKFVDKFSEFISESLSHILNTQPTR